MDIVIHTPTIEDYVEVVECAISEGAHWENESTDIEKYVWKRYKERTCVHIENSMIYYDVYSYYIGENFHILTMKEFNLKRKYEKAWKELR